MHHKIHVMFLVATSLCLWKSYYPLQKLSQKYVYRNANSHYFRHQRGRKTSLTAPTCNTPKMKQEQHYKKRPIAVYDHWLVLVWHILSPLVTDSTSPQNSKGVFDGISSRNSSKQSLKTLNPDFFYFQDSIVSSQALAYLAVPPMPNHCSCTSHFSASFQDREPEV